MLALGVALPSVFADISAFSDVSSGNRNAEAVQYVKAKGFVNGYADGTFKPMATINRAEFAKIVAEAVYSDEDIKNCVAQNVQADWSYVFLKDVPKDAWYAPYVCVARVKGLVGGYADGTYHPSQNISLVEAAKILTNAFHYQTTPDSQTWYKPFVEKLGEERAIPATILDFDKQITRGDMAEMIWRIDDKIKTKEAVTYNDLTLNRHDQTVPDFVDYTGNINVKEGNVIIGEHVTINGDILIAKGNITIGSYATINGFVRVVDGNVTMADHIEITGDFITERGAINLGSFNTFAAVETLTGDFHLGSYNTFNNIVQIGNKNVDYGDHVPVGNLTSGDHNSFADYVKTPKGDVVIGDFVTVAKDVVAEDGNIRAGDYFTGSGAFTAPYGSVTLGDHGSVALPITAGQGVTLGEFCTVKKTSQTEIKKMGAYTTIQ